MPSPGQLQRGRRNQRLFAISLAGDAADRARAAAARQALAAAIGGDSSSFGGGSDSGLSAGAGLLGAGLAATTGLSLATLGSEAGFVLSQPELALPGAVLLGLELSGVLTGKPKLEDTVQAAQRLMASPFEPLRALGQRLAIFARNGVPLSTSNPKLQAQIRSAVRGTVQTILSQYPLAGTADQIDSAVNAALTSQRGSVALSQLQQRLTRSALLTPQPSSPATMQLPRLNPATFSPVRGGSPAPMLGQGGDVMSVPATIPSAVRGLLSRAQQETDPTNYAELVGCVALAAVEPAFAAKCLEALAVKIVAQGAKTIVQSIAQFFRNQIGKSTTSTSRQPGGLPSPAPILDQQKPCPECERGLTAKQRAQLQQEREALQQEQQTEQAQLTQQQLDQIQTQIDQLKATEQTQQSDQQITQSLQEKADLLNQLTQIQQGQGREMTAAGSGQPALQGGNPAPVLQQNDTAQQIEQELEHAHEAHGVQFCVGCQSNEDAILFLNGEPSKCSVVPGTTKELHVDG